MEIKDGSICLLRNGTVTVVTRGDNGLRRPYFVDRFREYNEIGECFSSKDFDIIAIRNPEDIAAIMRKPDINSPLTLRDEVALQLYTAAYSNPDITGINIKTIFKDAVKFLEARHVNYT